MECLNLKTDQDDDEERCLRTHQFMFSPPPPPIHCVLSVHYSSTVRAGHLFHPGDAFLSETVHWLTGVMLTDIVVVYSSQNYQLVKLPPNLPNTYSYGYDFGLIYQRKISQQYSCHPTSWPLLSHNRIDHCINNTDLSTTLCLKAMQDINSHNVSRQHTVDLLKILGTEHKSIFSRQHWSPSWVLE